MPRPVGAVRALLFAAIAGPVLAQATFVEPAVPVPRVNARVAVDESTGDLYVLGGRLSGYLDTWRLTGSAWQRVADGPFLGECEAVAFDTARQRLVAVLVDDPTHGLYELENGQWVLKASLPDRAYRMVFDPVRQETLLLRTGAGGASAEMVRWDGANLVGVAMPFWPWVAFGPIAFDTARGVAVVRGGSQLHEWDGAAWTTIPASQGSWSSYSIAATDPVTGNVLFFGTSTTYATWRWDGQSLIAHPMGSLAYRHQAAIVGNAFRQRLQLVGGQGTWPRRYGDVLEFDGTSWQQVAPDSATPSMLYPAVVATGPGRALAFASPDASTTSVTAVYDAGEWTVLQPATAPPARTDAKLAYDAATGDVYLFGGFDFLTGALFADFWRFDGVDWQQLPGGPSARRGHGMCWRPDTGRLYLYGGLQGALALSDSWEWDGATWTQVGTTYPPSAGAAGVHYDTRRERLVLTTIGVLGLEVWELDDGLWYSSSPSNRPLVPVDELITTWDPVRERVTLINPVTGERHEWDGSDWTSFAADPRFVPEGVNLGVVGVPGEGVIANLGRSHYTVRLVHDAPASATDLGAACPDPTRRLSVGQPWLGQSYRLRYPVATGGAFGVFVTGFSSTQAGSVPLPVDLAVLGLPGCQLFTSLDAVDVAVPAGGVVERFVDVPQAPALVGFELFHQAAELSAGFTASSQGVAVVVGSLF